MSTYKEIIIDYREHALIELLNKRGFSFQTENLSTGDIVFKEDNQICLLIERKTIKDLYSSIKDGRLKDQKKRILEKLDKKHILYLIEGNIDQHIIFDRYIKSTSIYGSIFNLLIRDNIPTYNTSSLCNTCDIICDLYTRFLNQKSPFKDKKNNISNDQPVIQFKKKGDISKIECFKFQLCQIPGISSIKAGIFANKWKDISSMCKELSLSEDPIKLLGNLKINSKKLGKKQAENIIRYLGL